MTFMGTTFNEWTISSLFFEAKRSHLDEGDAGTWLLRPAIAA
jgi:hypothetical protein